MSQQVKNQDIYSGKNFPGINPEGSFDRMIYVSDSILSYPDILGKILEIRSNFDSSQRSRLGMKFMMDGNMEDIFQINSQLPEYELVYNRDKKGIWYLTMCLNKTHRAIGEEAIQKVRTTVEKTLHRFQNNFDFENYALTRRQDIQSQGFTFTRVIENPEHLHGLWEQFGWDIDASRAVAQSNEQIFGLLNNQRKLIGAVLFSDNESTEWAIHQDYRGQGLIHPLLIYSNAAILSQEPDTRIYSELRFSHSVSAAIQSGFQINYNSELKTPFLTNHVAIFDKQVDSWNTDRNFQNDNTFLPTQLRSFVMGQVNNSLYSPALINAYTQ